MVLNSNLNPSGKKHNEWVRERRKRLQELKETGEYKVEGSLLYGNCSQCGKYGLLDLHHINGRLEGHELENLKPICRKCHMKEHGVGAKKTKTRKKANWEREHQCKHCKRVSSMLLCPHCGKISV
jgi:hypothetical protein